MSDGCWLINRSQHLLRKVALGGDNWIRLVAVIANIVQCHAFRQSIRPTLRTVEIATPFLCLVHPLPLLSLLSAFLAITFTSMSLLGRGQSPPHPPDADDPNRH